MSTVVWLGDRTWDVAIAFEDEFNPPRKFDNVLLGNDLSEAYVEDNIDQIKLDFEKAVESDDMGRALRVVAAATGHAFMQAACDVQGGRVQWAAGYGGRCRDNAPVVASLKNSTHGQGCERWRL